MKRIKRLLISISLIVGLILACFLSLNAYKEGKWETIASSLAVITAIIAAFLSVRVIWKQEDDYEPDIIAFFDLDSRSEIIQFIIKNVGGSNAYDIKLNWISPLADCNERLVELPYVPVLQKGDCIKLFVDISTSRFEKAKKEQKELIYEGEILFKYTRSSNRYFKRHFEISLEQFRMKLRPTTDEQNFHLKNANLNENIKEINSTLLKLVNEIENFKN